MMWEWIFYPAGSLLLGYGVGWSAAHTSRLACSLKDHNAWLALAALSFGCALMYAEFASFADQPLMAVRALSYLLEGSAGAVAFADARTTLLIQRREAKRKKRFQDSA